MPLYSYECKEHGIIDIMQGMNDEHIAVCGMCKQLMRRIYTAPQLKCQESPIGTNRTELFDNLVKEGYGSSNWRDVDPVYKKENGITD